MRTKIKEVQGIDWFDSAVMNCVWKGPRLRDIIQCAGVKDSMRKGDAWLGNVACACNEVPCQDDREYGGSITLERAMLDEGDCILALEVGLQIDLLYKC
jgi:sulfite oxidase